MLQLPFTSNQICCSLKWTCLQTMLWCFRHIVCLLVTRWFPFISPWHRNHLQTPETCLWCICPSQSTSSLHLILIKFLYRHMSTDWKRLETVSSPIRQLWQKLKVCSSFPKWSAWIRKIKTFCEFLSVIVGEGRFIQTSSSNFSIFGHECFSQNWMQTQNVIKT